MKHYQLTSLVSFLLWHSGGSFSPKPWRSSALRAVVTLQYAVEAPPFHHAVDTNDNVKLFDSLPANKAWESLVPLFPNQRGCDVTVQWTTPEGGSSLLLQHLFPHDDRTQQELQPLLQESFITFQSLLLSHHKFKARIVATRGSSGTKCPRWHIDHVPLRWIQALVGPGCDYVQGADGIDWNAMNGMDTVENVNNELVNENIANIHHAPQGQGVVLWGAENSDRFPAVHKSPTLGPFEGRVLLTLDVVQD